MFMFDLLVELAYGTAKRTRWIASVEQVLAVQNTIVNRREGVNLFLIPPPTLIRGVGFRIQGIQEY